MVDLVSYILQYNGKDRLTMGENFPGDYYPIGMDMVLLIERYGVVQLFGKSRKSGSHACYASLDLAMNTIGSDNCRSREANAGAERGPRVK